MQDCHEGLESERIVQKGIRRGLPEIKILKISLMRTLTLTNFLYLLFALLHDNLIFRRFSLSPFACIKKCSL